MAQDLRPEDIEVFSGCITRYFETMTGEKAAVRSAYLLEAADPILWNDFNGLITVSGGFRGSVCFSAPRGLLSQVLRVMGEASLDDDKHRDIVGEIANTLSGQARRHFGEALVISTPFAFPGTTQAVPRRARSIPYAIPFTWQGFEAGLVVHLDVTG